MKKDIGRGVINTRALARFILEKHGIEASIDSIITAIRRYEREFQPLKQETKLTRVFKDANIMTKDNVVCYTLAKRSDKYISMILDLNADKDFIRISKGLRAIKVIVDKDYADQVEKIIPDKHVIKVTDDIGELNVLLPEKISKMHGGLAKISSEIAFQNINIEEIIIVPPEFLIYVKRVDLLKAYESIMRLRDAK